MFGRVPKHLTERTEGEKRTAKVKQEKAKSSERGRKHQHVIKHFGMGGTIPLEPSKPDDD